MPTLLGVLMSWAEPPNGSVHYHLIYKEKKRDLDLSTSTPGLGLLKICEFLLPTFMSAAHAQILNGEQPPTP